jgi:hypothetical protein
VGAEVGVGVGDRLWNQAVEAEAEAEVEVEAAGAAEAAGVEAGVEAVQLESCLALPPTLAWGAVRDCYQRREPTFPWPANVC